MASPIDKKPFPKKAAAFAAVLVLLGGCIAGCYLRSLTLPENQFYWWVSGVDNSERLGDMLLQIEEVQRNKDGSGSITYTVVNEQQERQPVGPNGPYVDYWYKDQYNRVYPISVQPAVGRSGDWLEPQESGTWTEELPKKALALPGTYRFYKENSTEAEFVVLENGEVVLSQ